MRIDRRQALALLGAGAAGGACAHAGAAADAAGPVAFRHGVASGDPTDEGAVLWTRVSPPEGAAGPRHGTWEVAADDGFAVLLAAGRFACGPERDWTVKAEAAGLSPGTEYRYRFRCGEAVSPTGRFRTLPAPDSAEPVTLAACSCALWPGGLFNAYRAIAGLERLDAVVHLGDYIYEYGAAPSDYGMRTGLELGRIPQPAHETVTLADYRARHAQAKTDPDLQAAHARAAWIVTFDDHEITNDPWEGGAQNHQPEAEGDWSARKAAALRAWLEWMPIREPAPGRPLASAARRSFRFGAVAALHMVETRLTARSRQLRAEDVLGPDGRLDRTALDDPGRRMLGEAQLAELGQALSTPTAWQVLGNQVLMARMTAPDLRAAVGEAALSEALAAAEGYRRGRLEGMIALGAAGAPLYLDAWDGYPAERERLYDQVKRAGAAGRLVVLSGDSHAAWANQLADAAGRPVGVEFGCTAISSPSPSLGAVLPGAPMAEIMAAQNPEIDWCDLGPRGFVVLSLAPEAAEARMVAVSTVASPVFETFEAARFGVRAGTADLVRAEAG